GAARAPCEGVLAVQRTKGQSERRLHGSWSIGLGGHVEPEDARAPGIPTEAAQTSLFDRALARELAEELDLEAAPRAQPRCIGLLNDDSSPVGRVHAGLVHVLDLPCPLPRARQSVRIREISK